MDPKEVQEKAIPLKVISLIEHVRGTEIQQATGQLIIGAFFYASRSCEYLKVQ
jgi:tRNA isopentenyl-2-thiomethyl-A-37 hydroxylase MiaE